MTLEKDFTILIYLSTRYTMSTAQCFLNIYNNAKINLINPSLENGKL